MGRKAFTTTTLKTRLNYEDEARQVGVTSGRAGISLWITPDPMPYGGGKDGSTNLDAAQARELARDLNERADEIDPR